MAPEHRGYAAGRGVVDPAGCPHHDPSVRVSVLLLLLLVACGGERTRSQAPPREGPVTSSTTTTTFVMCASHTCAFAFLGPCGIEDCEDDTATCLRAEAECRRDAWDQEAVCVEDVCGCPSADYARCFGACEFDGLTCRADVADRGAGQVALQNCVSRMGACKDQCDVECYEWVP